MQYPFRLTAAVCSAMLFCSMAALPALAEGYTGWKTKNGKSYWYEDGVLQGYRPNDPSYRGKEIYDPASNAWYWLDNVQQGAKTVSKDVYQLSAAGAWAANADGTGKWVRYDKNGHMVKGWDTNKDGTYYFDQTYGTMAKGVVTISGSTYYFDEITGIQQTGAAATQTIAAQQVTDLVNQERKKQGLSALTLDDTLCQAANTRAKEIVQNFSHTRPNGKKCYSLLDELGVSYRSAGENIAVGQESSSAVMKDWMTSEGHRSNILDPAFTRIGVGCVESGGRKYWVQMFIER